jgi:hypothetical protein
MFLTSALRWNSRWCIWLRHCATSRKVAGSIPDGVIEILHLHNPSGRTIALGLTQPLTEMSTRCISGGGGGKGGRGFGLITLGLFHTAIRECDSCSRMTCPILKLH